MVKSSSNNNNNNNKNDSWGMALLFIFFHNNDNNNNNEININNRRRNLYSLSSSSSSNLLLSKTQSTLSICALLFFTTLLLFTLSTFETTSTSSGTKTGKIPSSSRRMLKEGNAVGVDRSALHGIGEVYLRGSKSMSDLIVAHFSEEASTTEVRSFIRVVVYSGLLSRVDLVLLFPSLSVAGEFRSMVVSECDSLLKLVRLGKFDSLAVAGLNRYLRPVGDGGKEALWGKSLKINSSESTRTSYRPVSESARPSYGSVGESTRSVGESTRPSYGSMVGFEASELDPEDSLSGFLDHVPMSLRRWACYPMLLGRLRRNYKHMMLVDAGSSLVLSDPFTRVRNKTSESLLIFSNPVSTPEPTRSRRRNSPKEQKPQLKLNPSVLIGGSRGVRRFATSTLTEIVRTTIDQHKGKKREPVPNEFTIVNQLVHNGHVLKNVKLITPPEPIQETGSGKGLIGMGEYVSVVKRGNSRSGEVDEAVNTEICLSHKMLTTVYTDCLPKRSIN